MASPGVNSRAGVVSPCTRLGWCQRTGLDCGQKDWIFVSDDVYDTRNICPQIRPSLHRTKGGIAASNTVGLVVEYAPATGETRVRFPDGVACYNPNVPTLFLPHLLVFPNLHSTKGCKNKKRMQKKTVKTAPVCETDFFHCFE